MGSEMCIRDSLKDLLRRPGVRRHPGDRGHGPSSRMPVPGVKPWSIAESTASKTFIHVQLESSPSTFVRAQSPERITFLQSSGQSERRSSNYDRIVQPRRSKFDPSGSKQQESNFFKAQRSFVQLGNEESNFFKAQNDGSIDEQTRPDFF